VIKKYWPIKPFGKDIKFGFLLFLENFPKSHALKHLYILSNRSSCSVPSKKRMMDSKTVKLRNCEKAIKFLKNIPAVLMFTHSMDIANLNKHQNSWDIF
jgi:hypothetical protein